MQDLRIAFQGFWGSFNFHDNIFVWILKHKYNVIIDFNNPEIVISGGGNRVYKNCKYIYFSGEPWYPDSSLINEWMDVGMSGFYKKCDYSYIRFPLYLYYIYEYSRRGFLNFDFFNKERSIDLNTKTDFCVFIARGFQGYRAEFVQRLMNYKKVDISFGHLKNIIVPGSGEAGTIEGSIDKINFIRKYKFVVSFENCNIKEGFDGYTTEKLIEPMIANCLPLYWGNNKIHQDFNTKCFLNLHDFNSEEEFINKIIEIDNNDELYKTYFNQKLKNDNNILLNEDTLVKEFFEKTEI